MARILSLQASLNEEQITKLKKELPALYNTYFGKISASIFSNPDNKVMFKTSTSSVPYKIISNNDAFYGSALKGKINAINKYVHGKALGIIEQGAQQKIPIGYNIYLPEKKFIPQSGLKGIVVKVYGGTQRPKNYKLGDAVPLQNNPGHLSNVDKFLINQGVAVVYLNLVDLLELKVFQFNMPEKLHNQLHKSIDYMFHIIKNTPEKIHLSLSILKGKKIFLYGASFGGRTAIRHAELYPETFDGYISHDGWLSHDMGAKSDSPHIQRTNLDSIDASKWLSPDDEAKINRIKRPTLILHNLDDNNVKVSVSVHWSTLAKQLGKNVSTYFSKMGSTTVNQGTQNKGHFEPTDPAAFHKYSATLLKFITSDNEKRSMQDSHRLDKARLLSHEGNPQASYQERFLSEALKLYKSTPKNQRESLTPLSLTKQRDASSSQKMWNQTWEKHYRPLFHKECYIDHLIKDKSQLQETMLKIILQLGRDNKTHSLNEMSRKWTSLHFNEWFLNIVSEQNQSLKKNIEDLNNKLKQPLCSTKEALKQSITKANPGILSKRKGRQQECSTLRTKRDNYVKDMHFWSSVSNNITSLTPENIINTNKFGLFIIHIASRIFYGLGEPSQNPNNPFNKVIQEYFLSLKDKTTTSYGNTHEAALYNFMNLFLTFKPDFLKQVEFNHISSCTGEPLQKAKKDLASEIFKIHSYAASKKERDNKSTALSPTHNPTWKSAKPKTHLHTP